MTTNALSQDYHKIGIVYHLHQEVEEAFASLMISIDVLHDPIREKSGVAKYRNKLARSYLEISRYRRRPELHDEIAAVEPTVNEILDQLVLRDPSSTQHGFSRAQKLGKSKTRCAQFAMNQQHTVAAVGNRTIYWPRIARSRMCNESTSRGICRLSACNTALSGARRSQPIVRIFNPNKAF